MIRWFRYFMRYAIVVCAALSLLIVAGCPSTPMPTQLEPTDPDPLRTKPAACGAVPDGALGSDWSVESTKGQLGQVVASASQTVTVTVPGSLKLRKGRVDLSEIGGPDTVPLAPAMDSYQAVVALTATDARGARFVYVYEADAGVPERCWRLSVGVVDPPAPLEARATANLEHLIQGESTFLRAAATGGVPPYTFEWSAAGWDGADGDAPVRVTPNVTTAYRLDVIDAQGQTAFATLSIIVEPPPRDPPQIRELTIDADYVDCESVVLTVGCRVGHTTPLDSVTVDLAPFAGDPSQALTRGADNHWEWSGELFVGTEQRTPTIRLTATDASGAFGVSSRQIVLDPNQPIALSESALNTESTRITVTLRTEASGATSRVRMRLNGSVVRSNYALTTTAAALRQSLRSGSNRLEIEPLGAGETAIIEIVDDLDGQSLLERSIPLLPCQPAFVDIVSTPTEPEPDPGPDPCANCGTGDVQITLTWDTFADIDLYVVDPFGETIWYGNRSSGSGGQLDVDDINGFGPENIFWPDGRAPSGTYRVWVDYYAFSSFTGPTNFTVRIKNGANVDTFGGQLIGPDDRRDITTFSFP